MSKKKVKENYINYAQQEKQQPYKETDYNQRNYLNRASNIISCTISTAVEVYRLDRNIVECLSDNLNLKTCHKLIFRFNSPQKNNNNYCM